MHLFDISEGGGQAAPKDTINFVRGVTEGSGRAEAQVNNPDEIDIDMDDDNDEDENDDDDAEVEEGSKKKRQLQIPNFLKISRVIMKFLINKSFFSPDIPIEKQMIPSQVFGSLKADDEDAEAD